LKTFETTKLFYNEYANKLVVRNQLAHIFREKQWGIAKTHLDKLQHCREQGKRLELKRGRLVDYIDIQHLQDAQILYNELYNKQDVKIRVGSPRIQIYSNDNLLLKRLSNKILNCIEYWQPNTNSLIPSDTILLKIRQPYEYRVTLGSYTNKDLSLWIENNKDKVKIGKSALQAIQNERYTRGLYFYVRNERVLNLLQLIIGSSVQSIHKVIYK